VQNAVDQARFIAGRLTGSVNHRYNNVPWFWTHQAGIKLQMAGLPGVNDTRVVVGDRASGQFSVFRFDGRRLVCVESVNRVPDHMAARRILGTDDRPTADQVAVSGFNLTAFANAKSLQRQPH
jgi:3-phenylpropionate/trans-cinnamate dioxygenase ferredoxin reductase subunit